MTYKVSPGLMFRFLLVSGIVFALAYQIHAQSDPGQDDVPSTTLTKTGQTPTASIDISIAPALSASPDENNDTSISPKTSSRPTENIVASIPPASSPSPADNIRTLYLSDLADHRDEAAQLKAKLFNPETLDDTFHWHKKDIFLSPDRKFLAVTTEPLWGHGEILTYVADIQGHQVTSPHPGSFISWAPDSSKALLFLDGFQNLGGRRIYYLDSTDSYIDSGLPEGVISADISPVDGSIAYSLTTAGTDKSDLYLRSPNGGDALLLKGEDNILAWVRFAPDGKTIAFMKSDLYILSGNQSVWTINADGTDVSMISAVSWNYPAVWSTDGSTLAFANAANVYEYSVSQKSVRQVTNFDKGTAMHPEYSSDGQKILFFSDASGNDGTWAAAKGAAMQLTEGDTAGLYPILP